MSSRSGRRSNRAVITFALVIAVIAAALAMRWQARRAALAYGMELQAALFEEQGAAADGQPRRQRDLFNEPRMLALEGALRSPWNVIGLDYLERAEDLRQGMVYLHIQLNQPTSLRFTRPPKLRHFTLEADDKSDDGVHKAIRTLMEDYLGAVGSR